MPRSCTKGRDVTETPILQFGTSRFLQAHADLFISEALRTGQALGRITVVQSSGDAGRAGRLAALAAPAGFEVRIRGLQEGRRIDESLRVTSVARALSTATDWPEICRIAVEEARIILSNTADAGYVALPADGGAVFDQAMSYPAKLMHLLLARYRAGAGAVQVMPMELIADNGLVLRERVLALAASQPAGFRDHLRGEVIWVNSLVDRIVSQPLEPAGAVAEPYALWAIEAQPGLLAPCVHPAVQVVPDLEPYEALKLYILNLGHTTLAQDYLADPAAYPALVREVMADPARRARLEALYEDEVLPGFAAAGMADAARVYVATTLERFANPFLDHRIAEIAQNHRQKITRRIVAFLDWAVRHGDTGAKPRLRAIAATL